jgi:hypothetical protein
MTRIKAAVQTVYAADWLEAEDAKHTSSATIRHLDRRTTHKRERAI